MVAVDGLQRRIVLTVPHFLVAPFVVAPTIRTLAAICSDFHFERVGGGGQRQRRRRMDPP
jgi:hypothetical protein